MSVKSQFKNDTQIKYIGKIFVRNTLAFYKLVIRKKQRRNEVKNDFT